MKILEPDAPIKVKSSTNLRFELMPKFGPTPWLDTKDATVLIEGNFQNAMIIDEQKKIAKKWITDGYSIIPKLFSDDQIDSTWEEYEKLIKDGIIETEPEKHGFPGRYLNPHFYSSKIRKMMVDEKLISHLSFILGVKTNPFQSIIGHRASEQKTHSDSIHMTTYPGGYMIAAWIAMEDISADSGPLVYYPGSHKLPYVYSSEAGITLEEVKANQDDLYKPYRQKYEPLIEEIIREKKLSEKTFIAKKGDVLIWHANLLHGGSMCKNFELSRKALVCHYFSENCLKYHDYTGAMANDFSSIFQEDLHAQKGFISKYLGKLFGKENSISEAIYLSKYPDVKISIENGLFRDAKEHYNLHGKKEGRKWEL